jgi:periplasmic protein TonB
VVPFRPTRVGQVPEAAGSVGPAPVVVTVPLLPPVPLLLLPLPLLPLPPPLLELLPWPPPEPEPELPVEVPELDPVVCVPELEAPLLPPPPDEPEPDVPPLLDVPDPPWPPGPDVEPEFVPQPTMLEAASNPTSVRPFIAIGLPSRD